MTVRKTRTAEMPSISAPAPTSISRRVKNPWRRRRGESALKNILKAWERFAAGSNAISERAIKCEAVIVSIAPFF
jgi:hypothetical protein